MFKTTRSFAAPHHLSTPQCQMIHQVVAQWLLYLHIWSSKLPGDQGLSAQVATVSLRVSVLCKNSQMKSNILHSK